ncbi:spondin domain-containing protein [Vibrio sp.]|uniref:spondin domain-containing protein n=1 Tax=Vibrio sp. TaxID=678 RepID=UPI003D0E24FA
MKFRILVITAAIGALFGCPDDNMTGNQYRYSVQLQNLTANQPLSPMAVITHNQDFHLFAVGSSASLELEQLAEGGDNSGLLAMQDSNRDIELALSGNGVILPGQSDLLELTINRNKSGYLSLASMLVNTNDGFVGSANVELLSLKVGESLQMPVPVWDAGTELDDESAATVPGPAAGGEGFNAARDDVDQVSFHSGVISADDGLASSALNATHRFNNPGAMLTITRVK